MLPKRLWADMTWADFAAPDTKQWIAVLPVAAIEQHGPHLPLGTDSFIAEAYLAKALPLIPAHLPVTILPVQTIGLSTEHLAFPGTLSLSASTMIRALTEIGECVRRAGVRKLLIVTSHGGNVEAIDMVARDLRARCAMLAVTCAWHRFGYAPELFDAAEEKHGIHGGDIETSLMLAARPTTVRMDEAINAPSASVAMETEFSWLGAHGPAALGWMTQDLHGSGAVGDARGATADKGETALVHGARAFVALLEEIARFDLDRLANGPLDVSAKT
jgi:creatinine amidohydrolase